MSGDVEAAVFAAIRSDEATKVWVKRSACNRHCRMAGVYDVRGRKVYVVFGYSLPPEMRTNAREPERQEPLVTFSPPGRVMVACAHTKPEPLDFDR